MSFNTLIARANGTNIDRFGEPVTFWDAGYRVDTSAIVAITDPTIALFDGTRARAQMSLTVLAEDVTGITANWHVDVRGQRRPVLEVNSADQTLFSILIGDPE